MDPRLKPGDHFRLIGRTTVFKVSRLYHHYGMPCVAGKTLDGKQATNARIMDVEKLADAPENGAKK